MPSLDTVVPTGAPAAVRSLSQELIRLTRASNALRAHAVARGGAGLEWSSYVLLFALVREGPQRLSALAEAVQVDPSTASRQVAALVRADLVERRPDPEDGRACLLAPTPAGDRLYAEVRERRDRALAAALAGWAPTDVEHLAALLARLNESLAGSRAELLDALTGLDAAQVRG